MFTTPEPYRRLLGRDSAVATRAHCSVLKLDRSTLGYATRMDNLRLCLPLQGSIQVHQKKPSANYQFHGAHIAMLPPNSYWEGAWQGSITCLLLKIPPVLLSECHSQAASYPFDGAMQVVADEQIRHAMLAIHQALLAPAPAVDLFTQHMERAVTAHYLQRYCATHLDQSGKRSNLSSCQMTRLHEFIVSQLQRKLTLDELASEVGMSVATFCRHFKQTTGLPPYKYVLRTRVELAKKALRKRSHPLSEIALSLGFYDQSQFANTFRRLVGLSPRAYRNQHNN